MPVFTDAPNTTNELDAMLVKLFPFKEFLHLFSSDSSLTEDAGESSAGNAFLIPWHDHRTNPATEMSFINVFFPMPLEDDANLLK